MGASGQRTAIMRNFAVARSGCISTSENGEYRRGAAGIIRPCLSTPTPVTARWRRTIPASTVDSSSACRRRASTAGPCAPCACRAGRIAVSSPVPRRRRSSGYRPCLRCRPELAPGNASVDSVARLAQGAIDLIENGVLEAGGIEHLAARVGVTSRHLRRIFETEFGVSPIEYAQTQRLLLAKRLLTDTGLPVTEVASASGFASVRRFNALFKARYRMAPGRLRETRGSGALPAALTFELAYRPPYDWESMLAFLGSRAIDGIERVDADSYARTLAIEHRGARHVGPCRSAKSGAPSGALRGDVAFARACGPGGAVAREARIRPVVRSRARRGGARRARGSEARAARSRHVRRLRARRPRGRGPADLRARGADDARPHRPGVRRFLPGWRRVCSLAALSACAAHLAIGAGRPDCARVSRMRERGR